MERKQLAQVEPNEENQEEKNFSFKQENQKGRDSSPAATSSEPDIDPVRSSETYEGERFQITPKAEEVKAENTFCDLF